MNFDGFYDSSQPFPPAAAVSNEGYRPYALDTIVPPSNAQHSTAYAQAAYDEPTYSLPSPYLLPDPHQTEPQYSPPSTSAGPYTPFSPINLDFDVYTNPQAFSAASSAPSVFAPSGLPGHGGAEHITQSSLQGFDNFAGLSAQHAPTAGGTFMGPPALPPRAYHTSPRRPSLARRPSFGLVERERPSPIYDLYGSSVVSVAPSVSSHKLASNVVANASAALPPVGPPSPFDAAGLGLPAPPPTTREADKNWQGLYSSSGIDMMGILARVVMRPNPEIQLGPVDLSCSFLVVDARKFDMPIVYASDTFSRLTGYTNDEILGRNCRFLQSPDGVVAQGSKRKYTDNNAVHHLREHIIAGKETQASLINYYKGGKPFINLITCVPITWDSDEIAYFVGFQVDLVAQPAAILEKMKNGTYVVNYTLSNSIPRAPSAPSIDISIDLPAELEEGDRDAKPSIQQSSKLIEPMDVDSTADILAEVERSGVKGLASDSARKQFNRLLLENCDDFVHVVSLKGSLLYVSPSAAKLLQYEPEELIGKTLASVCHPSDIVAVLRELKESGNADHTAVNLLYRIRRKHSGYMWLEASGKLHVEQGKGRKCIILVGRPQRVYNLSWADLERAGGLGEKEYWSKFSLDGMHLYTTTSVQGVLGYSSNELMGSNIKQIDENGELQKGITALNVKANSKSLAHKLRGKDGTLVDVVTNFYPDHSNDEPTSPVLAGRELPQASIIAQTNLLSSELAKHTHPHAPVLNRSHSSGASIGGHSSGQSTSSSTAFAVATRRIGRDSDGENSSDSNGPATSFSAVPSMFKTLSSSASDNIFDELEVTRGTSWQFELHQLRLVNRKLREEKDALAALQRKRRKRAHGEPSLPAPKAPVPGQPRSCANCGRTGSPEWRSGPTGPKSLCNACGLRYAKFRGNTRQSPRAQSGSTSATPSLSPSSLSPDPGILSRNNSGSSASLSPGGSRPPSRPPFKSTSSSQTMGFSPVLSATDFRSASSSGSPGTPVTPGYILPPRPLLKTTESSLAMELTNSDDGSVRLTYSDLSLPPPLPPPSGT